MDFSLGGRGGKTTTNSPPKKNHNKIALSVEHGFDMKTGGEHPCLKRAMQSY